MSKYMFRTTATMKPYNNRHWYISGDIIRTKYIDADNLSEALAGYADDVRENNYITISANGLRNKSPMYIDSNDGTSRQVGYVITAAIEMQRDNGSWSTQYIDLWIDINRIESVDFEEAV